MRASEWIAFVYFVFIAAAAWLRRRPLGRRLAITTVSALLAGTVWLMSRAGETIVRDWAPLVYLLSGYFASGALFTEPSAPMESWLIAWDRRFLGDPTTRFARWPRVLVAAVEVVYMGCFLLLPAGFALLVAGGHQALVDRYWTFVNAAEFGSFAPLAFIQTRPPWALERPPALADQKVHRLVTAWTQYVTIHANTFPSGHVAGSLSVAFAVLPVLPLQGLALLALALAITLGCIVGRYHYIVDAIAGALLAIAVWIVVSAAGM